MEEEVRDVVGRRVADGEDLKPDIKKPICQKWEISSPTEAKQGAFDIGKTSTHVIWENWLKQKKYKKKSA